MIFVTHFGDFFGTFCRQTVVTDEDVIRNILAKTCGGKVRDDDIYDILFQNGVPISAEEYRDAPPDVVRLYVAPFEFLK